MIFSTLQADFFKENRLQLISKLPEGSTAVLISNPEYLRNGDQFFPFRQNSNLFYLSGIVQPRSILTICPGHKDPKMRELLFIEKTNEAQAIWTGQGLVVEEAQKISGIGSVYWLDSFWQTLRCQLYNCDKILLALNENSKLPADYSFPEDRFAIQLRNEFPGHGIGRLGPIMEGIRMVKRPDEIEMIGKAAGITLIGFEKAMKMIRPGVSEKEVEATLTYEFTRLGFCHAYMPIIGSGSSACTLHYIDNNRICKNDDLLLMDFGAEVENYTADCTRTVPVNGRFNKRQRELYELVLRVQKETMKLYVPGNTLDNLNKQAGEIMQDELLKIGLLKSDEVQNNKKAFRKFFMHGLAHFLGLDVHDPGDKYRPFEKGMVLTCEPGIYIRDEATGIRIENDIVVDNPPIDLMYRFPGEVNEIEDAMKV